MWFTQLVSVGFGRIARRLCEVLLIRREKDIKKERKDKLLDVTKNPHVRLDLTWQTEHFDWLYLY